MTTLIEIPSTTAFHIPTPGSQPLPLATGTLSLTLIPANPPVKPAQTVTLTVGGSSFTLLPISPVQRTQTQKEHASYIFSPVPADGGAPVGQVRIHMKDSTSQGEWEATEALCRGFEEVLKSQGLWEEKVLFVDDEYETGGPQTVHKGWGETIAGAVIGAGQALADRLHGYTDKHVDATTPAPPTAPSPSVASAAHSANTATASFAASTASVADSIGSTIHEGGKRLGDALPDSIVKPSAPVAEADKSDLRKTAESNWEQATIAAKGVASAAVAVGTAISDTTHQAIEHNFGKPADNVAQEIGQAGANVGSAAVSAVKGTSVIVQGSNAATGAASAKTTE